MVRIGLLGVILMTEHKYAFSGRLECISILRIIGALGIALYHIGCFNDIIPTLQGGYISSTALADF